MDGRGWGRGKGGERGQPTHEPVITARDAFPPIHRPAGRGALSIFGFPRGPPHRLNLIRFSGVDESL